VEVVEPHEVAHAARVDAGVHRAQALLCGVVEVAHLLDGDARVGALLLHRAVDIEHAIPIEPDLGAHLDTVDKLLQDEGGLGRREGAQHRHEVLPAGAHVRIGRRLVAKGLIDVALARGGHEVDGLLVITRAKLCCGWHFDAERAHDLEAVGTVEFQRVHDL